MVFNSKEYYIKNKQKINEYNRNYWRTYYKSKIYNDLNNINKSNNILRGCIIKCNVRVTF